MRLHWHMGKQYKEVDGKGKCNGCSFEPPPGEICWMNIWSDSTETSVVCGVRDVILVPVRKGTK